MIDKIVELFRQFLIEVFRLFSITEEEIEKPTEEVEIEEPLVDEPVDEPFKEETELESNTEEPKDQELLNEEVAEEEWIEDPDDEFIEESNSGISIDELAKEVINGKWGSGDARKKRLEEAGYDYYAVQARVNDILNVVDEVLEGKWGSGDTRKQRLVEAGYDYYFIQELVTERVNNKTKAELVTNMNNWATKIANDNRYHYVVWTSKNPKTKTCPICTGRKYDDAFGWNCIGFCYAVWHHGGGLKCRCNCGVIGNNVSEKMLKVSDAEALKIAKEKIGLNDIKVIRNNNGIPKSQWEPGDICLKFNGDTYTHNFYYMGNGKVADSIGSNGKVPINNQIAIRDYKNYSAKIIIRYTGLDNNTPKKTIDELAHEVIDGKWGSGETRKKRLTEAGYDYDAVQARVNELLEPQKKTYPGVLPTLSITKSNAEVINDTCKWASWIAGDNRFHYGYTNKHGSKDSKDWNPNAHHNGCYFCGTNTTSGGRSKKGIVDYERTYCCNPFVGAAWAHGGCVPKALSICQSGSSWDFHKGKGYDASSLFTNLGHPAKSSLKKGDVCCTDSHVFLYLGDGKLAEASSGDDNVRNSTKWNNSIHVISLSDSKYKGVKRVHRFNSSVNTEMLIRHGEISDRVAKWQAFLDWYFDGQVGSADGYYGDNTLKWTKEFQEKEIGSGQGDGIIGNKTLEAAKKCEK